MQKIIVRRKSRRYKQQVVIIPDEPSRGSMAEYLLLKYQYVQQDQSRQFILYKSPQQVRKRAKKKKQARFNLNFLKKELKKRGVLKCSYCKREGLIPGIDQGKNYMTVATADHFLPKCHGGDPFNESNLVVSCAPCNHAKGGNLWHITKKMRKKLSKSKLERLEEYLRMRGYVYLTEPPQAQIEIAA